MLSHRWAPLRPALLCLCALLSLASRSAAAAPPQVLAGPVPATVTAIPDGDTIEVVARIWLGQTVATRVRFAGIDAPELRGRCQRERDLAEAARAFLEARLVPPRVELRDVRFGKFAGRVVARVFNAAGEDLSAALLAAGLARPYDGGARDSWCDLAGRTN